MPKLEHALTMFMTTTPLRWPKIITTSALSTQTIRLREQEGWWRPMKGYLVEPPSNEPFAFQRECFLGYVRVLAELAPEPIIFAGITAAMLLRHPVWPRLTNIEVYKTTGRRDVRALRRHPRSTAPVLVRPMRQPSTLTNTHTLGHGVTVTTREQTAVDVARLAASESAFITVCSILGQLATTGDNYRDRLDPMFLEQESAARARMIELANQLPCTSGRQRAKQIISLASGQVESVAEARVLWIIHAYGLPAPLMQHRIVVDGREYFGDFVWPDLRLIVEFNGEEKYRIGEHNQRVAAGLARESILRSAGYEIINLSWAQLQNHEQVARLILKFLSRASPMLASQLSCNLQIKPELSRPAKQMRSDARHTLQTSPGSLSRQYAGKEGCQRGNRSSDR